MIVEKFNYHAFCFYACLWAVQLMIVSSLMIVFSHFFLPLSLQRQRTKMGVDDAISEATPRTSVAPQHSPSKLGSAFGLRAV